MISRRRAFILGTLYGLLSLRVVWAQPANRMARVGFLAPGVPATWGESVETFRQALRELGWAEGQNLIIDVRYAESS